MAPTQHSDETTSTRDASNVSYSDRQGFNRRWYAPGLRRVFTPTTAEDVVFSLNEAISFGLEPGQIQITCGRHCYEGFVYNDNTRAIIDVTGLR